MQLRVTWEQRTWLFFLLIILAHGIFRWFINWVMLRFHLEFACHWQLEVLLVEKHAGSLNKLGWGAEKKSRSKKRCRRRTDGTLMWHNDLEMRAKQGMRVGSTVFSPHPKETVMLEQKNNLFFCFFKKVFILRYRAQKWTEDTPRI